MSYGNEKQRIPKEVACSDTRSDISLDYYVAVGLSVRISGAITAGMERIRSGGLAWISDDATRFFAFRGIVLAGNIQKIDIPVRSAKRRRASVATREFPDFPSAGDQAQIAIWFGPLWYVLQYRTGQGQCRLEPVCNRRPIRC